MITRARSLAGLAPPLPPTQRKLSIMTSEQAEKLSSLVIRYATLRDEMYHAVKVDDPKRLDRAVLKFREATDHLWDTSATS